MSMSTELKVGLTIVISLVVFLGLLFSVGDLGWFENNYELTVIFDSAAGLVPDAKVLYAGVRGGSVESVEWFQPDGADELMVKVVLSLDEQVVVREDSIVAIRIKGFMADKYIDITTGTPSSPAIAPGAIIYGERSVGIEELFESAGNITAKIGDALAEFSELLDEETVSQLKRAFGHIESMLAEMDAITRMSSAEILSTIRNLRDITDDVARITQDVSHITANVDGTLYRSLPHLESAIERFDLMSARAVIAVDHINDIVATIASGEGTLGKLVYDDSVYEGIDESLIKAQDLLDRIIDNPREYLNLSVF